MAPLALPSRRPSYLLWLGDILLTELTVDIDQRDARGQVKAAERRIANTVNATIRDLRQLGVAAYDRGRTEESWEAVGDVLLRLIVRPERAIGLLAQLDADHAGLSMRERRASRLAAVAAGDDLPRPPAA